MSGTALGNSGCDPSYFSRWICDLDYELIVTLAIQLDNYCVVGVVYVIEDAATMLVKGAGSYETGDLRAWHPDPVPPAARGFPVDRRAGNVRERDLHAALQRPDLVHPLNFEDRVSTSDRYVDQA